VRKGGDGNWKNFVPDLTGATTGDSSLGMNEGLAGKKA